MVLGWFRFRLVTEDATQNSLGTGLAFDVSVGWNSNRVTHTNDYAELGISADGRNLITIKGDTTGAIWSFSPTSGTTAQMTTDSRGVEGMFGLAQQKDGRLVFSRSEAKEADLWTSDKDGKNGKALFAKAGFLAQPTLTPDGKFIVFNLQKDKTSRIWRMDANGQKPCSFPKSRPK